MNKKEKKTDNNRKKSNPKPNTTLNGARNTAMREQHSSAGRLTPTCRITCTWSNSRCEFNHHQQPGLVRMDLCKETETESGKGGREGILKTVHCCLPSGADVNRRWWDFSSDDAISALPLICCALFCVVCVLNVGRLSYYAGLSIIILFLVNCSFLDSVLLRW